MSPGAWVMENVGVYVKNATAVRDFRVQLRGNRAVILWTVYLLVLIGFGMLTYSETARRDEMSVVEAQASLQSFYMSVMGLLVTLVALIAPALTATAVVAERQRQSLDLVFSSPVSPKYYLVGKMISSYRYIWMLLVLSLPVTAACVVLGGASWSEVLATYGLISLHGLIYTSIALLFSTLAKKPVGAVIWSYIGVATYVACASSMGFGYAYGPSMSGGNEMPFVVCLSPYQIFHVSLSYTTMLGYHVPNWALAAVFTLLVTKLMLLSAASVLSPYGSPETKSLRIHGLIYMALYSFGTSVLIGSVVSLTTTSVSATGGSAGVTDIEMVFARQFVSSLMVLAVVLPFISCYGTELEKKFWPDGIFRVRRMLIATPSGGLPYLLALCLAAAGGIALYGIAQPGIMGIRFVGYMYYGLALIFACWSVGRLTSALNNGLRYARTLQFTLLVLTMALPPIFLSIVAPFDMASNDFSIWDLYILRPLASTGDRTGLAVIDGTILLLLGSFVVTCSEALAKSRYSRAGISYDTA